MHARKTAKLKVIPLRAEGVKIVTPGGGPGGIYTTDGKIISFWYK